MVNRGMWNGGHKLKSKTHFSLPSHSLILYLNNPLSSLPLRLPEFVQHGALDWSRFGRAAAAAAEEERAVAPQTTI